MGYFTLARFKALLLANPALQGQSGIDSDLARDWINMGYFEVCGAVAIDELTKCASLETIEGTTRYLLPGKALAILSLQDKTSGAKLIRTSLRNLHRLSTNEEGYVKYYARKGSELVIWPKPDASYAFECFFVAEPNPLINPTDVTILPATWDKPILLLATEAALRNFNLFDEADKQFMRAIQNMKSRLNGEDLSEPMEGFLNTAHSEAEMMLTRPDSGRF